MDRRMDRLIPIYIPKNLLEGDFNYSYHITTYNKSFLLTLT